MNYCYECGHKLVMKELEHEGRIPFCTSCRQFRFPIFSTAISMVTLNPKRDKLLMIQQYGKPNNILVAGYVNKEKRRGCAGEGNAGGNRKKGAALPFSEKRVFSKDQYADF